MIKKLLFRIGLLQDRGNQHHSAHGGNQPSLFARIVQFCQPPKATQENDRRAQGPYDLPKGMHIFNIVRRARVHALSIYSTPPILATGTPVLAGDISPQSLLTQFIYGLDFVQVLVLILIAALFFKDEVRAILTKYLGIKPNGNGLATKMDQLKVHYNEETTHLLKDILHESRRHSQKVDIIIDQNKTILARQDEMIKYGIPERKR